MKLRMFVACEKVIVDANGAASIINLLQAVKLGRTPGANAPLLPPNAVVPKEWALAALWYVPKEYLDRQFVQMFEILWPDGTEFAKNLLPFKTTDRDTSLNYLNINAMPLGQEGALQIKAWVEEPNGTIVTDIAEFSISVKHDD